MEPKVVVNGKEYPIATTDSFTMGEEADVEEIVGQGYKWNKLGGRGMLAIIYVSLKRADESVTIDDVRQLKPEDITYKNVKKDEPVPPTSLGDSTESATTGNNDSSASSDGSPAATPEPTGTPV